MGRVPGGIAGQQALTTFHEIPDVGTRWTLAAAYGGRGVHRTSLARSELAAGDWTVTIPPTRPAPSSGRDSRAPYSTLAMDRNAPPIRRNTTPRPAAIAATPKATTEVNNDACRNDAVITVCRFGSSWGSCA